MDPTPAFAASAANARRYPHCPNSNFIFKTNILEQYKSSHAL